MGESIGSELDRAAVRRLGQLCLLLIGFFALTIPLRRLAGASGMLPEDVAPGVQDIGAAVTIVLMAGLYALTRSKKVPAKKVLGLGIALEVGLCFDMAFMERALFDFGEWPMRPTFAIIVLLVFPAVVPLSKRQRLSASALSVVAIVSGHLVGGLVNPYEQLARLWFVETPTLLFAGLGLAVWKIIDQLGEELREAKQLGNYELVESLGAGGMGEVWRAKHSTLVRPAAVKLIRKEVIAEPGSGGGAEAIKRFEREAQITSQLRSPHTVDLYDFGTTPDGTLYYAMELLDGIDLDGFVGEYGPMKPARVAWVLRQAALSLAEAHNKGLVHRDIKPANIFLCRMGVEHDFVKVLDFGLVRPAVPQVNETKLTAAGVSVGTPAFMPPEMALGEPIDARTDIYALGAVGYWLLTGDLVFTADSPLKVLMSHVSEPPVPPSERSEEDIPAPLEELIMRCLAKAPSERPQSAGQIVRAIADMKLDGWVHGDATSWWALHRPAVSASSRA